MSYKLQILFENAVSRRVRELRGNPKSISVYGENPYGAAIENEAKQRLYKKFYSLPQRQVDALEKLLGEPLTPQLYEEFLAFRENRTPWGEVKNLISNYCDRKNFVSYDQHKLTNAISAIIRLSFGINNVSDLKWSQFESVRDCVDFILKTMSYAMKER